ncbi:hypothetical protein FQR65_LT17470 [Abscondita terminalis]|nr:hypothetical protein FQR65_LT17470 [Abscondita terminalis]
METSSSITNASVVDVVDGYYIVNASDGAQYKLPVGTIEMDNGQLLRIGPNQFLKLSFPAEEEEESDMVEPAAELEGESSLNISNYEIAEWSDNPIKLLIGLYKNKKRLVENRKIKTLKQMWNIIGAEISSRGYLYTPQQCENKWKSLERCFKKTIENKKKTGRGRKNCPYERELGDILLERASIVPPLVVSSSTTMTKNTVLEELSIEIPEKSLTTTPLASVENSSKSTSSCSSQSTCNSGSEKNSRSASVRELKKLREVMEQRIKEKKIADEKKFLQQELLIKEMQRKNDLLEKLITLQTNKSSN